MTALFTLSICPAHEHGETPMNSTLLLLNALALAVLVMFQFQNSSDSDAAQLSHRQPPDTATSTIGGDDSQWPTLCPTGTRCAGQQHF